MNLKLYWQNGLRSIGHMILMDLIGGIIFFCLFCLSLPFFLIYNHPAPIIIHMILMVSVLFIPIFGLVNNSILPGVWSRGSLNLKPLDPLDESPDAWEKPRLFTRWFRTWRAGVVALFITALPRGGFIYILFLCIKILTAVENNPWNMLESDIVLYLVNLGLLLTLGLYLCGVVATFVIKGAYSKYEIHAIFAFSESGGEVDLMTQGYTEPENEDS